MRRVDVTLPSSPALVGLVLALPFIPYAGAWLTSRAVADPEGRRVLAPGVGVASWLVTTEAVARIVHDFITGLVIGTIAIALVGLWYVRNCLTRRVPLVPRAIRHKMDLVFMVGTFIVIVPAVGRYAHDELFRTGHLALVSQFENGTFPPRFSQFAELEFPYHYGFDLIAAAWGTILRLSASRAIDVTTTLAWFYTAWLGCYLGRKLCGARRGTIAGLLVLFGGGIHLFCTSPKASLGHKLMGVCNVDGIWANPPLGSYFFQHPFGLGIPFFLTILSLLADRAAGANRARYVVFAILFLALSQSQFVLFVCGSTAFVVAESFHRRRRDFRRVAGAIGSVLFAWIGAIFLGGFLTDTGPRQKIALVFHLGATNHLWDTLIWTARTYGILLPIGLAGLFRLRREKLFVALVASGAFLVPNLVRYRFTWDIVKFATVAELALALSTAAFCIHMLERYRSGKLGPIFSKTLASIIVIGGIGWSISFHAAAWLRVPDTCFDAAPATYRADDAAVISYLRRHVKPGESVYRSYLISSAYSQWGGLSTPWPDEAESFGFAPQITRARRRFLKTLPPDAPTYAAHRIVWFVLDSSDTRLRKHGHQWVQDGLADIVLQQGDLLVLRFREKR